MAINRWEPKAGAVAQVDTVTVANTWATNDTVTLKINSKDLLITIGSLITTAQVATTIQEAWEGSDFTDTTAAVVPAGGGPDFIEHSQITATVASSVVTLTRDTAGVPFTMSVTEVTGGSGTATEATATSATGPNHVDDIDNWSAGYLPESTSSGPDDVHIDNTDVSLLYGLDQFDDTKDETSLTIGANFTGDIGLPEQNAAGYKEYFPTYLQMDVAAVLIGNGDGSGSGRIKLDFGDVTALVTVESTGSPAEFGLGAVLLKGSSANNELAVLDGFVDVATIGGETATIVTARVVSGTVNFGDGVAAMTLLENQNGTITIRSNITACTNKGGEITISGTATVGTLNADIGTILYESTGTCTTANIGGTNAGASVEFPLNSSQAARTFTTTTLNENGSIVNPDRATFSNAIAFGSDVLSVTAS